MNEFKQKFLRKLKVKLRKVKLEHKETEQIFKVACVEFYKSIGEYCSLKGVESPFLKQESEEGENKNPSEGAFSNPEVKDLYKKIATSTHPDKLINLKEGDREERTHLFKRAAQAKGSSNLNDLAEIAIELKIDLNKLQFEHLELIEKQIEEKEGEADKMRRSCAWVWYYLSEEKRSILTKLVCSPQK